ncbi:serine hydrolase [Xanthobacter sp. TB0139]|uniref:serine hydrolase n=1 Tax=Xanthobacter sp. TB0139 TaxID=3459178 RepID=UPI004039CF6A
MPLDLGAMLKPGMLFVAVLAVPVASLAGPAHADSQAVGQSLMPELGASPAADVMPLAPEGISKALATLPDLISDIMTRSQVPGLAVAVVHDGKTVFAQGYGVRELGKPEPVDADTVFQIASLSKPITATITATQVTAGLVGWDDKVQALLPDLHLSDPWVDAHATIGDFQAHRSGLPHAAGDDLEDMGYDRAAILKRLALLPLTPFRISYNYANFGTTIGGEAVAAAAKMSWEDLAETALYTPLGMSRTSSRHADFLQRANRATLHVWEDGRFQPLYARDPDAQSPAGGVSSSVTDLAAWLKLLLAGGQHEGREMISSVALVPMLRPEAFSGPTPSVDARSGFYGYGFNVSVGANGRPLMSHSGAFVLGAATHMQMLPSADIAIVVLTNGGPVGAAEAISAQFMDVVQYGVSTRDWYAAYHPRLMAYYEPEGDLAGKTAPADAKPAMALSDYVGTYDNAYFGPAKIVQEKDGLVMIVGPAAVRMPLRHWSGNTFAIAPNNENAPAGSLSSVTFVQDADGKARAFMVEYFNHYGQGKWTR